MHHSASPEIFQNARELRDNLTEAEKKLWEYLSKKQLGGLKFRRQHSVSKYILDFYCHRAKLGIELDGKYHEDSTQKLYDEDRTANLQELGIKIIRFQNQEIFESLDHVLNVIKEEATKRLSKDAKKPLSPKGEQHPSTETQNTKDNLSSLGAGGKLDATFPLAPKGEQHPSTEPQILNENLSPLGVGGNFNPQSYYAHPTAILDSGCQIGANTKIWHFTHIMPNATIGQNCSIGQNVFIASGVELGNNVKVQNNVSIYEGVVCEDDVFLGPSMVFTNVINPRSAVSRKDQYQKTLVKKGATIGANATIICGNTIGQYAFIGAGTVVTKSVPNYALLVGNPGKQIGWISAYGERLKFDEQGKAVCKASGEKYRIIDNTVSKIAS